MLESRALALVSTLSPGGAPQTSPIWFLFDGGQVRFSLVEGRQKLRNLRRDPRIALSVASRHVNEWGLLEYLVVHGTARVTEGGAPELLQRLAHRYLGPDVVFPPMPDPPPGFVTRIRPERFGGVGPWSRPAR